ncbi:MAG: amidohydrolase [Clostridia bacterium]
MLIINAKVYTLEQEIIENGFIKIHDNLIEQVGDMTDVPSYEGEIFDATGKVICPGFIDVHTHLGIVEDSLSFEGDDVNEDTDPITPELRAIDGINPFDRAFSETLKSGVTTVLVSAGSANPIAGQMALLKTDGVCVDEMILDEYIAMKFALGENPKSVYNSKNQAPVTRMATAALIRENLFKTKEYLLNKEKSLHEDEDMPDFEMKYEALIPVLQGKVPAHFHAHRADDIFTAIRICKEFDIKLVLVHATDGYLIADKIKQYPMIIGPIMTDRSKPELSNLNIKAPKILADNDVLFSISTDHPETPLKFLTLCAAIAVKEGLSEIQALECITINPAKIVGFDDKIGSIKVGKHADLAILSGNPLEYTTKVEFTMINGVLKPCEK